MIGGADPSRLAADDGALARVRADASISKAADARTHLTQPPTPILHGRCRQGADDIVTEQASHAPERKTAVPTARGAVEWSLAFGQLLDSKGFDRTERTERKKRGS